MRKYLKIALAMAVFAVVGWSCEDEPKTEPTKQADNSYFVDETETAIVWAGVETGKDVYTIYLAEATPASTTSPITIEGLTITISVEVLGVEHVIGTAGVEASLNGTPLTGGTLLVTKTETELVVDIKDSKVGEDDFSANWEGAFTIVEPEVIVDDDWGDLGGVPNPGDGGKLVF